MQRKTFFKRNYNSNPVIVKIYNKSLPYEFRCEYFGTQYHIWIENVIRILIFANEPNY
jgi:hypothetical protein